MANKYGINFPMVKDPKTGLGSVSLTLLIISSIMVILGLVGKWSGRLGIVDINNSLEFFYASSALYFGRSWVSKSQTDDKLKQLATPQDEPTDEK